MAVYGGAGDLRAVVAWQAAISVPAQLREGDDGRFVWRTNLLESFQYWREWFVGMTAAFLGASCPKLLIITDWGRLDDALCIAQKQGRFAIEVVQGSAHSVHEDHPVVFARTLYRFFSRFNLVKP
jgi:protein phosphatase methylesterase 1